MRSTGIDYQIGYEFDLDRFFGRDIGEFTASLAGTYLIEREDTPLADFPEDVELLDGEFGFPRNFFNFGLGWSKGPWRADYGFNFQSSQVITGFGGTFGLDEQLAFAALIVGDGDPTNDGLELVGGTDSGTAFIHTLGGSYTLSDKFEFSIRVNNLGDRDPFPFLQPGFVRSTSFVGRTVQFGIRGRF